MRSARASGVEARAHCTVHDQDSRHWGHSGRVGSGTSTHSPELAGPDAARRPSGRASSEHCMQNVI